MKLRNSVIPFTYEHKNWEKDCCLLCWEFLTWNQISRHWRTLHCLLDLPAQSSPQDQSLHLKVIKTVMSSRTCFYSLPSKTYFPKFIFNRFFLSLDSLLLIYSLSRICSLLLTTERMNSTYTRTFIYRKSANCRHLSCLVLFNHCEI